jgi:chorismate-pyruvate lyase
VLDAAPASLWARRSLFLFGGSRLLVTEVFLPAILALAP